MSAVQPALPLGFAPSLAADSYVVSEANRHAAAWLAAPQDWPMPRTLLVGPSGAGKTHLSRLFAGTVWDDADRADAEALFHAWNAATTDRPLLMTASRRPLDWGHGLPDLASRLAATPQVRIGDPDDALITAVLAKQFADRGIRVGEDVLAFLCLRIERSFAAAADVVDRLDTAALASQRAVTVPLAREVLEGQLSLAV
ncbi:HdaA/DnaA family protein [Sandarakinorhabdus sp.]|uniref:HdaA/DnaA family protein n=1 Tax=Sandarakinorhabdus sp. TaxID=1916663 RepID=UPI00286E9F1A|nr:chromosomal replication initiator DnaA [Sandarakinorhabdus sp.]